jgi:cytochrome P450
MSALPGPKDHSFGLSLARRMQSELLQFSQEMAAEFGDLAFFRVGPLKICLLNHPDLIHEALSTRVKSFPKFERPIRQLAKMDGQAITVTEGDAWLRGRRVVQPAFQASRLDPYGEIVVEATRDLASRWQAAETVDAAEEFCRLTLQTMTRTLFGARAAKQAEVIESASREYLDIISRELYRPFDLPDWLPLPSKIRKRRAVRQVRDFVRRVVEDRRSEGGDHGDLLSTLLHAAGQDAAPRRLSNEQALSEAIGLFRAGHDAMSSLLAWTTALLAQHPAIAAKVREEVQSVTGGRPVESKDWPQLAYTECVAKESLRLYPPAWMLFVRQAAEDVELTCGESGPYRIPRGTQVFVTPWSVHRDPRFFPNPLGVDPERFLTDRIAAVHRHAFMPFGIGPHACIGNAYSLMHATLSMAVLAQHCRCNFTPSRDLVPEPVLPLRIRGGLRISIDCERPTAAFARSRSITAGDSTLPLAPKSAFGARISL